jgi:hypothetical protein
MTGRRYDRQAHLATLDPVADHWEIYQQLATLEFPWDMRQALGFALFRTYAVPSIGALLHETREFGARVQKRYDDTALLLDAVLEHSMASAEGRTAVRRINQMHGSYDISNDDLRYVLATFVVVPTRWLDRFGWRRLTEAERAATAEYYRQLGRHMGIRDLPADYAGFAALLDAYEQEHFAFDPGGRAVADATVELLLTFPPTNRVPKRLSRWFVRGLLDAPLAAAFGYPTPGRLQAAVCGGAVKLRGRAVRRQPPRTTPVRTRDLPEIRSYPGGYRVEELGTFPRCPVRHEEPAS